MKTETRQDWEKRINRVLEEVTGSLDENLLAERLSKEAASSRWHFERAFRSVTGETFAQVVKRLRLERAAFMLKEGTSVLETALDAGYESAEAFARAFKRAFGLTPSRVASLPWWKGELPSPNGLHWRPNARPRWQLSAQTTAEGPTRIVTLPTMRLLVGEWTDDYWRLPSLWQSLHSRLAGSAMRQNQRSFMTVFSHEGEYRGKAAPGILSDDSSESVTDSTAGERGTMDDCGHIGECDGKANFKVPGGLYAITTFTGPCEAIGPYWDDTRKTFFAGGPWSHDRSRPSLEWYQNSPPEGLPELTVTFLCDAIADPSSDGAH